MTNMPFVEFLTNFRGGALEQHCSEQFAEMIREVLEKGTSGKLTLEITAKQEKGGQTRISPRVTAKLPATEIKDGYYFADNEGGLHSRDPNQSDLEDALKEKSIRT